MTKISLSTKTSLTLAVFIISAISTCTAVISDKRLCYDPLCSEPVSLAKTLLLYNSNDPWILSFPVGLDLKVFSKEAGSRVDLWGVEIGGKRGYAPKKFIREYRVLKKNLTFVVPTEPYENIVNSSDLLNTDASKLETSEESNESIAKTVQSETPSTAINAESLLVGTEKQNVPDVQAVTPSYEVIDGTIIPLSPQESPQVNYATQLPPAPPVVPDEQPILSIHPDPVSRSQHFVSSFANVENPHPVPTQQPIENNGQVFASADIVHQGNEIQRTTNAESQLSPRTDPLTGNILANEGNAGTSGYTAPFENVAGIPLNGNEANSKNEEPLNTASGIENETEKSETVEEQDDLVPQNSGKDPHHQTENANPITGAEQIGAVTDSSILQQTTSAVPTENTEKVEDLGFSTTENPFAHHTEEPQSVAANVLAEDSAHEKTVQDFQPNVESASGNIVDGEQVSKDKNNAESEMQDTVPNNVEAIDQNIHGPTVDNNVAEDNPTWNTDSGVGNVPSETHGGFLQFFGTRDEQVDTVNQHESTTGSSVVEEQVLNGKDSAESVLQDTDPTKTITQSLDTGSGTVDAPLETHSTDDTENSDNELPVNDVHNPDGPTTLSEGTNVMQTIFGFDEKFSTNRNLLNVEDGSQYDDDNSRLATTEVTGSESLNTETPLEYGNHLNNEDSTSTVNSDDDTVPQQTESTLSTAAYEKQVVPPEVCDINNGCVDDGSTATFSDQMERYKSLDDESTTSTVERNYWETAIYLFITASSALIFSLGYYYIENTRRDGQLVGRINKLEKELLVTTKECMILDESLKVTKSKLNSIEDESFGSNEMVASLKSDLEASQNTKIELEEQIATLEKELESATEAGLELERMLREILESQSDDNPLAQSVEDLQARLNAQQATNETLTKSLTIKKQENEALSAELAANIEKCQQLEIEMRRVTEELEVQINAKNEIEQALTQNINQLEIKINEISKDKSAFRKELMSKEMEVKDLWEVVNKVKSNDLDIEKLCNVSHVKAEAKLLLEERDELKVKLSEVEGAHQLLADHMKLVQDDIASLSEQYRLAEKEKKDAETRLEVLSKFFNEKEAQRQKEEAKWLQKQGEVMSTVERIQTMQSEIENYKQQIEMLKREIIDQEREYKNQISTLENKTHEQWVVARQNERRLEESKAEASQLRNRLTLVEKNINEVDPDSKLHRLETNGETAASPPLYMGAESSSSPIMFTGSSGVPPPHPSYMYGPPLPPFLPPPPHPSAGGMYDISQRPPPLGGRLSSPPPLPLHPPLGRYDDAGSPPPPLSPPLHPYNHRSPPPPFSNDRIHPPPPPLLPPLGTSHSWGDETLPAPRNPGYHPQQREHRLRNHKGSLHSSGESLDKSHHGGKV